MMSDSLEDLKNLVSQSLESKGVLSKLRAELRKYVFEAIDEVENASPTTSASSSHTSSNSKLAQLTGSEDALLLVDLIVEFLEFFELDYTLSVFAAEAKLGGRFTGRRALIENLSLTNAALDVAQPNALPLLVMILKAFKDRDRKSTYNAAALPNTAAVLTSSNVSGGANSAAGVALLGKDKDSQRDRDKEKERNEEKEKRKDDKLGTKSPASFSSSFSPSTSSYSSSSSLSSSSSSTHSPPSSASASTPHPSTSSALFSSPPASKFASAYIPAADAEDSTEFPEERKPKERKQTSPNSGNTSGSNSNSPTAAGASDPFSKTTTLPRSTKLSPLPPLGGSISSSKLGPLPSLGKGSPSNAAATKPATDEEDEDMLAEKKKLAEIEKRLQQMRPNSATSASPSTTTATALSSSSASSSLPSSASSTSTSVPTKSAASAVSSTKDGDYDDDYEEFGGDGDVEVDADGDGDENGDDNENDVPEELEVSVEDHKTDDSFDNQYLQSSGSLDEKDKEKERDEPRNTSAGLSTGKGKSTSSMSAAPSLPSAADELEVEIETEADPPKELYSEDGSANESLDEYDHVEEAVKVK